MKKVLLTTIVILAAAFLAGCQSPTRDAADGRPRERLTEAERKEREEKIAEFEELEKIYIKGFYVSLYGSTNMTNTISVLRYGDEVGLIMETDDLVKVKLTNDTIGFLGGYRIMVYTTFCS